MQHSPTLAPIATMFPNENVPVVKGKAKKRRAEAPAEAAAGSGEQPKQWMNEKRGAKMVIMGMELEPLKHYQTATEYIDRVSIKNDDATLQKVLEDVRNADPKIKAAGRSALNALRQLRIKSSIGKTGEDLYATRRTQITDDQKEERAERIARRKTENEEELVNRPFGYANEAEAARIASAKHGTFYQMRPAKGMIFGKYTPYKLDDARTLQNLSKPFFLTNGTITGGPWRYAPIQGEGVNAFAAIPAERAERKITRAVATYVNPNLPISRQRLLYKIGRYVQKKDPAAERE